MYMAHEKLVRFFLRLSSNLKLYHWCTKSYTRHVSSDAAYEAITALIDRFIEVYFGKYGRPHITTERQLTIDLLKMTDVEATLYMRQVVTYMNKHRDTFCPDAVDTDLSSILDEIIAEINKTIYLFSSGP
jgi:hypothetical protein